MPPLTPYEPSALFTAWTPSPFGIALVILAAAWYLWHVAAARRIGVSWPWWRVALYLTCGVGTFAYAVCGPLEVYRASLYWIAALHVGVLATLTPVGLALGDPINLLRAEHAAQPGRRRHWVVRALEGRVARVLMFPALSSLLAVGTISAVFFTPLFVRSTESEGVSNALDVILVASGLLFVLPLLVDELLPAWATPAIRTLLAFADGLLDAIPGLLVMTSSTLLAPTFPGFAGRTGYPDPLLDQHLGGGALLAVAESVGIPVIGAVMMEWVRSDAREAKEIDGRLDAEQQARSVHLALRADQLPSDPSTAPPPSESSADGLWWEQDPRFSGRFRRPT